jgi:hypothetical protein
VTARANGTQLLLEGSFQSGGSTPILVWPRAEGQAWLNPCAKATDLCCLRQLSTTYRNDALASVMPAGTACLRSLPPNLVGGSRPGVRVPSPSSFAASVPLATPFVAVLFVHASPFFMLDGYQPFSASDADVQTSLVIDHNPCYSVVVPGTLVSVCMQCNNRLPPNARYVWTPSWYLDYTCDWQCSPDYVRNGPECEPAARQVPLVGLIAGASATVIVAITAIYCALRRNSAAPPPPPADIDVVRLHSEMIQFKDVDAAQFKVPSLRVKRN